SLGIVRVPVTNHFLLLLITTCRFIILRWLSYSSLESAVMLGQQSVRSFASNPRSLWKLRDSAVASGYCGMRQTSQSKSLVLLQSAGYRVCGAQVYLVPPNT
ncbi:hypothetical protein LINPERHAP2_LOCUS7364, partial [Linum perenne]